MENLTQETFKEKIMDYETHKEGWVFNGDKPAIIDFYADWCMPCKTLTPILEDLEKFYDGKIDLYKIDTEEQNELASMFGIRNIPSVLFIPKEGEPQMTVGVLSKNKFVEVIEDIFEI
jgi:thioredoxin 1